MTKLLIFTSFLALMYAYLENQIEGKRGWAEELPCWKKEYKWLMKIMGGRPLTGYHVGMVTFTIYFFHLPILFVAWTPTLEYLIWGLFFYFLFTEDLLWFVISPYYSLEELFTKKVPWHNYWSYLPDCYYYYPTLAAVLIYLGRNNI